MACAAGAFGMLGGGVVDASPTWVCAVIGFFVCGNGAGADSLLTFAVAFRAETDDWRVIFEEKPTNKASTIEGAKALTIPLLRQARTQLTTTTKTPIHSTFMLLVLTIFF